MERASDGGHNDIATKITNMNTVLEAFGNAKTRNNDNSSRFGKYLQLFLNDAGAIVGAKTDTYLLEKVRVVRRDPNERNYHIFYMMLAGIDETLSQRLHLDSKETFTYLSTQGQPPKTLDDATEFRKLEAALDSFGISGQVRENLYKVLAAIILCGQIEIVDKEGAAVIDSDDEFLHHVAELLGIGAQDLAQCICTSRVQAAGASVTLSARTAARAKNALDTMSKYMYVLVDERAC
jgi:myosin-5